MDFIHCTIFINFTSSIHEYRYWNMFILCRCGRKEAVWVVGPELATHQSYDLLQVTLSLASLSSSIKWGK